jgi:hypothetical protein
MRLFRSPPPLERSSRVGASEGATTKRALVMEIPLDLERTLERRWAASVYRTKRIALKGCINRMPRPASHASESQRSIVEQRQEAEAFLSGSIIDLAEIGLMK